MAQSLPIVEARLESDTLAEAVIEFRRILKASGFHLGIGLSRNSKALYDAPNERSQSH